MQRLIKKATLAILSFTMVAAVMGCSSSGINQQENSPEDGQVTLKFVWWGSDQRKESTLQVIELYKKEHPHVNFETEVFSNTTDTATQLAIQTANQNTADIIQADYNFIFNYINRDLIEPLDPYVNNNLLNLADIEQAYLAPGMKNEQLYALAIANNAQTIVYNPELFNKAGVAVPKDEYTIDDLHNTLVQLKQQIDDPDFYPLGNMIDVFYYLRARGASMYNADGTALGYEDDQIMTDYYTLYRKWIDEGLLIKNSINASKNDENHPIVTEKAAMYSVSSNAISTLSKLAGHTMKLLPFPVIQGGQEGKFIKPSMFLAMSSYSKNKEEAAKFIDFFINNEEANDILNGERGVPVSNKIAARLSTKLDEAGKEQYRFLEYLQSHSSPIDPPYPSSYVVVNNAYQVTLQNVIDGDLSPKEGALQYRSQAEQFMGGKSE
ncbi:MAG: ABC transporter substrate-binding protein [Candidatus Cohnella colombiensis]|uniref:ABC transporter substrate-binding protein n=1 Tax=Candidatus Cohnella colombiensis TaxID=3121368 RepID=A0AA95JC47_9BACL|nr:MAG: ABC transporter substrate-binding protein [Cohnella sp.]